MPAVIHKLAEIAARIDQPFALVSLGLVGDIGVHLYTAQGQLEWHKHIDEDELFLVYEGAVRLETELGSTTLYAEEAMLVPKGIGHRSSSALRSVVLLFRQQILAERKNGRRNYLVTDHERRLAKTRLGAGAVEHAPAYEPLTVAVIEGYKLSESAASDFGPEEQTPAGGAMLYALRGAIGVEMQSGGLHLNAGELTIIPSQTAYKLHAAAPALVVKFERGE